MTPAFRLTFGKARRVLPWLAAPALLAGCRHDVVVAPTPDDYFPVVVGTYRTYAVTDSTWDKARASVVSYQLRERVAEGFTDASGQPALRLVRSRRASAAATWVDDSVLVVQVLPRAVLLTRNNVRTVELVYPVQANKGWNDKAFTAAPDTITSRTRFYGPTVAGPYAMPPGTGAPSTFTNTVLTKTTLDGGQEDINLLYQRGLRQVYAAGVGLVLRRRFSFITYTTNPDGSTTLTPGVVQSGIARREVLLETGTI